MDRSILEFLDGIEAILAVEYFGPVDTLFQHSEDSGTSF
jgi:hypothetical protein